MAKISLHCIPKGLRKILSFHNQPKITQFALPPNAFGLIPTPCVLHCSQIHATENQRLLNLIIP